MNTCVTLDDRGVRRRDSPLYLLTGRKVSEAEMQELMDRKNR